MTATTVATYRPNGTTALGSWTVVGASNAHSATSDNSDDSYIQTTTRCRLDSQRCRLAIEDVDIPAGSKIFSVGVRVRVQTVTGSAKQPQCLGWFRCNKPQGLLTTIVELVLFLLFGFRCPKTSTTTWVEQELESFPVDPAGNPWTLASFNDFEVNLGRDDDYGNALRISEVYVDVYYAEQPTISVTAPTGSVTDTCRPTVKWTYSSAQSNPQQAYRVAVYTSDQVAAADFEAFTTPPVLESGWQYGEDLQWTLNDDIVNGAWYAYVQVQQQWSGPGTFQSEVESTNWTQGISGAPIANFESAEYEPEFNRVKLVFSPGDDEPETKKFAVQVLRDPGGSWGPVRGGALVDADGSNSVTVYDYEAPLNKESQYRILAYTEVSNLLFAADDYSETKGVTPTTDKWWIKDILDPTVNTVLPVAYLGDSVLQQKSQGVYPVITGSKKAYKVAISGPQYGIEGTLNLVFTKRDLEDYWTAFQAIEGSQHVLLLQNPKGEQHYIVFGPGSSGSDKSWTWDIDPGSQEQRYAFMQVSYTEVAPPPITS